jgi:hypothetical protein
MTNCFKAELVSEVGSVIAATLAAGEACTRKTVVSRIDPDKAGIKLDPESTEDLGLIGQLVARELPQYEGRQKSGFVLLGTAKAADKVAGTGKKAAVSAICAEMKWDPQDKKYRSLAAGILKKRTEEAATKAAAEAAKVETPADTAEAETEA